MIIPDPNPSTRTVSKSPPRVKLLGRNPSSFLRPRPFHKAWRWLSFRKSPHSLAQLLGEAARELYGLSPSDHVDED